MTKKASFLRKLNEAFAYNNADYILENVTDDIRWEVAGEQPVEGREAFAKALKEMESEEPFELTINDIITDGDSAAVHGTMKSTDGKSYAFCDIYKFRVFKVKEITSYIIG